jgi:hypothetical protein
MPMVTEQDLKQFTGSERLFRHWTGALSYTEGIQFLADKAGCSWLVDLIALAQRHPRITKDSMLRAFQIWELIVNAETKAAELICKADSDTPVRIRKRIQGTDFPLPVLKLYVECGEHAVLMLPSER